LWTPSPAAAQVAVEQLYRKYNLRENSTHIVCLPVLMTYMWIKQLLKRLYAFVGLIKLFLAMGHFPLEDTLGMEIAVCMLQRSLDKGRYRDTLQVETVRKLRSVYLNIWHASRQTLTTSVMARDLKKTYITSCPTYGLWFKRFVIGMHKRMGDEVHQD